MEDCAVYQIVNERTLKFYIGSAKSFSKRYGQNPDWTKHKNKELKQDAIAGDKFIYCKIQECSSIAEALCQEQWWLDFYVMNNLWDRLYNRNKYVWKCRPDNTGRKASEEQRAKISAATRVAMSRPEVKARNSESKKIAMNRPEVRLKNSAAQKAASNRPEVKMKRSAAQLVAQNRPETRAKKSVAQKVAMNKPGARARNSESKKIAMNRPEVKIKFSCENNYNTKLTNLKVLEIRERYACGEIASILAKEYNVSKGIITRIVRRETWKLI